MAVTGDFFEAYPEARDIFPVYSPETVMRWTGEMESSLQGILFNSFPITQREYSHWFGQNIMLDEHVRKEKERELSEKYASMFRAKITHLLDFIGPKTPTERTKDILDLRNEFFAYPVKIEQSLLETFQTKQIDYFGDISKEALTNNDPFRDFFMEAMEYSQEAVPVFDQKKHLFPHFTGFVRKVCIWPEGVSIYSSPIFEARGAYIKNGTVIWSISELDAGHNIPDHWKNCTVTWYSKDSTLDEIYLDTWGRNPDQAAPRPSSQVRKATFQYEHSSIKEVRVTQELGVDGTEIFTLHIIQNDNTHKIIKVSRLIHTGIFISIKTDPSFFLDGANVLSILSQDGEQ